MAKLVVQCGEKVYEHRFVGELPLIEGIRASGATLALPCGGNHTCGKCRVLMRNPPPPQPEELRLLPPAELARGVRLACFITIRQDTHIFLEQQGGTAFDQQGHLPPFAPDPAPSGTYGFAVDIGTTTLAVSLYPMGGWLPLTSSAAYNRQSAYGADVISRIQQAAALGVQVLQDTLCDQLAEMMGDCMSRCCITPQQVTACVLTGNTTMLHLLTGLDPSGIAVAPFTPQSLFGSHWPGERLGLSCPVYLPRCAGAYLGADITCAALAADLDRPSGPALLVDIGTNGEMVLAANGRLWGCSTAAGPAFEGAGISRGMPATAGAINRVFLQDGKVCATTIDNAPAVGICGSGLMDAVAVMLQIGAIDDTGLLQDGEPFAIGDTGVCITQEDIRQIQLAKAAIAAGIDTLLAECGITAQQIEHFYLAGGFGSTIDVNSAAAIGLFPKVLAQKAVMLGNAAANGAALALLSQEMRRRLEQLGETIEEIHLSANAGFMERYIDRMLFDAAVK